MADHRAEQIIDAVVTTVTGLVTTGSNVFRGRLYNVQPDELPALCVYMGPNEPIDDSDQTVAFSDWDLEIAIDAKVRDSATQIDQVLNLIAKEITVALKADRTQGLSFVHDTREGGSDQPELSGDGDKPIANQTTKFIFKYRRSITDPSA